MTKIKVLSVFGTRPEAIKMAPLVRALDAHPDVDSRVCVTAQHRAMLDQVCALFGITPDHDLNVMSEGQTPTGVLARVVSLLEPIMAEEQPDWVLVQGDTTTAMAAGITAAYSGAKVGHVEAGLRTFNKQQPFPEELNRLIVGSVGDMHFAPTSTSKGNLLREGHDPSTVFATGNSVIDALFWVRDQPFESGEDFPLSAVPADKRLVLVTAHRRENFGEPMRQAFAALAELANKFEDSIHLLYPVHPNPQVTGPAHEILGELPNVTLTDPLDYGHLVQAMNRAHLVITDSGGIQEEAPSLGKPVLVLRDVTERPEAVEFGTVELVGCDPQRIIERATALLTDDDEYQRMAQRTNPYGDGHTCERIVAALTTGICDEFEPVSELVRSEV